MTNTVPEYVAQILEKLSGIGERIAKLEERTDWSKTLVTLIFAAIVGGVAWSGVQQYQLGSLAEASKQNESQLSKVLAAMEKQSEELRRHGYSGYRVAKTAFGSPTRTITQCGVLSSETKVDGRDNVYRLPILFPVDSLNIHHIWVGLEDPVPNTGLTGRIVEGGKFCEVEVVGSDPTALSEILSSVVNCCMSLTVSDSFISYRDESEFVYPGPSDSSPPTNGYGPALDPSENPPNLGYQPQSRPAPAPDSN